MESWTSWIPHVNITPNLNLETLVCTIQLRFLELLEFFTERVIHWLSIVHLCLEWDNWNLLLVHSRIFPLRHFWSLGNISNLWSLWSFSGPKLVFSNIRNILLLWLFVWIVFTLLLLLCLINLVFRILKWHFDRRIHHTTVVIFRGL